ncbi:MAG: isoprenylcysteine carboxylmethyltransferase family protein [Promethearchaeota archaeon]|nr:MAG: isoprenylcysteine carboxylmethyltransferase family protein [Candidatus Lokiarchaeota archaeon]
MNSQNLLDGEREAPFSHLIQATLPIIFLIIWILDTWIFLISVWLNSFVPLIIRIGLFAIVLTLAFILIYLSHKTLFDKNRPSNELITNGILKYVRNPLYLGVLLIYLAFIFLSISLISIILFIIIFVIYNRMVNFEEKMLEEMFSDEYMDYKNRVSKWIPNPFRNK